MTTADFEVRRGAATDVPALQHVFGALHDHHGSLTPIPLTQPADRAWAARASTYYQAFDEGRAILHLADGAEGCIGYAFTILHPGSDDTFPFGDGYAELYTLAVLAQRRGSGVGTALLDAVDSTLAGAGIKHLSVSVMVTNTAAIRLYESRGLVPTELIMYR